MSGASALARLNMSDRLWRQCYAVHRADIFFGASTPFYSDHSVILGNSWFFHIRAIGRLPGASRDNLISSKSVQRGHKKILGGVVGAKLTLGGHFGAK